MTQRQNCQKKFREKYFRPFVTYAIHNSWTTISIVAGIILITCDIIFGGYLQFHFFHSRESTDVQANIQFAAGTPLAKVKAFVRELETSLEKTDKYFSDKTGKTSLLLTVFYAIEAPKPKNAQ